MRIFKSFLGLGITLTAALLVLVGSLFGSLRFFDYVVQFWSRWLLRLACVDLSVCGTEKIPQEPCIIIFNHQSLLDIPILFQSISRRLRFGAKKELFYIPVFGWSLKILGMVEIDRKNRARAIKALKKAVKKMKKHHLDLVLAPEGTRQAKNQIGSFKSGPFVTAIEYQMPILPIVIHGASLALPKENLIFELDERQVCKVEILDPIFTVGLKIEDREQIKCQSREAMLSAFLKSQ